MTAGPWLGGIQVRRMDRGQTPVADFLCTRCGHHRRVTGRDRVTDFIRSNPASSHTCTTTNERSRTCPGSD